jgi:glycosyltransferase involved in cell wall biosynthesis
VRIAFIAPPWVPVPPPAYGGTELVVDTLARELQKSGSDVLMFATGDSTCSVPTKWQLPEAAGTDAIGTVTELRHVIAAYEAIQEWGADIVHDHTLFGPFYAARFPTPVVTTNHGPFASDLGETYAELGETVPIIAISHHQASTAQDTRLAAVIHHGIDLDGFPLGEGDGGYALFLGRMSPEKGAHRAARIARAAGVPLKIAAKLCEPPEHAYFESEVRPLLGNGIEYVGEVGRDDKAELLAGASCLLNPVDWPEPFGLVMIEALACGTPLVATPCGSVPEIVNDGVTGFVRSSDAGLAEAMRQVEGLDRTRCRKDAVTRFSSERMAGEHLALYREVASRHRTQNVA